MAINPNNGVLDIVNGVLKVSSIDIKESGGFATAINTVARNDVLLYDDQHTNTTFLPAEGTDYRSTTGVTRDTSSIDFNNGWVYWPLKLPNSWHAQFDVRITATGGVFTFSLFNTSTPNHTDYTANDGGYKIVFDNTNNQIDVYWEGSIHASASANVRSTDWQHVNINYFRGAVSISLAGKVVLNHGFTENYQEADSRYIGFSATSGTSHEIRNLVVHNSDKWFYTHTSNASDIAYVSGKVGIGSLTPTELLDVHGNVHIAQNLVVDGNLMVTGTTFSVDQTNLSIEDPIIELAKGNVSDTIDAGLIITRPTSNVAVAFRGDERELALGYTQSGASGADVVPVADGGLDVRVYGNVFANNVTTTANVEATYLKGDGSELTHVTLDQVVGYSNTTANTILLTNSTMGLVATGNVEANYFVGDGSELTNISTTLQAISDNGNVTSNTIRFTNATTAFVADSNVGIGTRAPTANLHVVGHQYMNDPPTIANSFDHSDAPLTLTHPTPTSTTAIDDPKPVLHLTRDGTSGESYGSKASFKMSRYENSGTASRSRLDVSLTDGTYTESTVMTLRADGKVGVGTVTPAYTLDVVGNINLSGDFYQGGEPFVSSEWTSGVDSLYYRSNVEVGTANLFVDTTTSNVGVGTSTPGYALDVVGDINLSGDFYQGGEPFVSSEWTSGVDSLYYRSNVEVGTANLFVDTTTGNVGVGTASPTYKLDVRGTSNVGALTATIGSFSGDLAIGTSKLFVDASTGNVGIGTASPDSILHVRGTGQTSTTSFDTSQTLGASIFTESSDSVVGSGGSLVFGTYQGKFAAIKAGILDGSSNTMGNLHIMTRNATADATLTNRMTITNTGNVGIGTSSPAYKLDVHGTSNVGALTATSEVLTLSSDTGTSNAVALTIQNFSSDYTQIASGFGSRIQFTTNRGTQAGQVARSADIKGYIYRGAGGTSDFYALDLDVYGDNGSFSRGISIYGKGDGSTILPADVTVHGNLGIGTTSPAYKLDVHGTSNVGALTATTGTFSGALSVDGETTHKTRTHIHQSGNQFTGLMGATDANGRAQLVLSSAYSDVVIASSQENNNHGSTLSFVAYNPSNVGDYRKFVINQGNWGTRKQFLDFGYADVANQNPHTYIDSTDTVLTLDGINKRVGIKNINPSYTLDVNGTVNTGALTATSGTFSGALTATSGTFSGDLNVTGKIYNYNYTEVDINAPDTVSGTWTTANASEWGDPKFNNTYDRYRWNDAPGYVEYTIPTGMKSAYLSQLTWSVGGYVDIHGVQSDGGLVFLRRINTRQNVENSNEGNPDQLDGSTITFAGSGLQLFDKIRLTNKLGRFHMTGLAFTPNQNEGTEGVGMVHSAQICDLGSGIPTPTGTGASGTWGINITGSAGSAGTATNQSGGTVNATTGTFSGGGLSDGGGVYSSKLCATLSVGRGGGSLHDDQGTGAILKFQHATDDRHCTIESVSESTYSTSVGIRFRTSNERVVNEVMRIKGNGNVGIGVTSPGVKLDIAAASAYTPAIRIGTNTTYDDGQLYSLRFGGSGLMGMGLYSSTQGVFGRQGLGIHIPNTEEYSIRTNGWTKLFALDGATNKAYFGGNVGIGTVSPAYTLDFGSAISNPIIRGKYLQIHGQDNNYGPTRMLQFYGSATLSNHFGGLSNNVEHLGWNGWAWNQIYVTNLYRTNEYGYSDDRLKTNETTITNAMDTLLKLKPEIYDKHLFEYDFLTDEEYANVQSNNLTWSSHSNTFVDVSEFVEFDVTKIDESQRMHHNTKSWIKRTLGDVTHREAGFTVQDTWYDAPELRHIISLSQGARPGDVKPDGAQNIEEDSNTYTNEEWGYFENSISYTNLHAYTIKALQEVHAELQAEKAKTATLETQLVSVLARLDALEGT